MSISRGFVKFDKETGLVVYGKQQILLDLINICKTSYGQDYTVDEGTEMYAFLDNLAFALAETGSAVKSLYDAFGFTMATGTPLDVLCSLAGISRKQGETDTSLRARYFQMLYTPSVSTVEGLKAKLMEATIEVEGYIVNIVNDVLILNNDTNSEQTIDNVSYTYSGTSYDISTKIAPHSIMVIVDVDSLLKPSNLEYPTIGSLSDWKENATTRAAYEKLDNIVRNYKSLGCGVSSINGKNILEIDFTDETLMIPQPVVINPNGGPYIEPGAYAHAFYTIIMAQQKSVQVSIKGSSTIQDEYEKSAIINEISTNILEYINSLHLGQPILYSGIMCSIFHMYEQLGYNRDILDINSVVVGDIELSGDKAYYITPYQYARTSKDDILISLE